MHSTVKKLINIDKQIKSKIANLDSYSLEPKVIAVSKTFKMDHILPLIEHGHKHFGENKVQEAVEKWSDIKKKNKDLKLHLIGKLQSNKVKFVSEIFDYIHSLDNEKLANKISDEQKNKKWHPKLFIQVNIGNENQKSGLRVDQVDDFVKFCKELKLNIIGLMCIPPINEDPEKFFLRMNYLNKKMNLFELSMGMSSDYLTAIEYNSTFLRIGSEIFGKRT
jgi:pyridoxal phosphate enzyme (YggS family)